NLLQENRFGVVTNYGYHATGDLYSKTNARGYQSTFSDYVRGVARSELHPEGVAVTRTVDNAGNVLSERNGEGYVTTYAYDGLNRVTGITYPTGSPVSIAWYATSRTLTRGAYDESIAYDGFGRSKSITREGITTTMQYNALGQKTFE